MVDEAQRYLRRYLKARTPKMADDGCQCATGRSEFGRIIVDDVDTRVSAITLLFSSDVVGQERATERHSEEEGIEKAWNTT